MSHADNTTIPDSTYPVLQRPEFLSQIPENLLKDCNPRDVYIMGQLSKLSQHADWSVNAHMTTDQNVRRTNGRLIRAEGGIAELQETARERADWWKTAGKIGATVGAIFALIYYLKEIFGHSGAP